MCTCNQKIKRKHWNFCKQLLDERLSPAALRRLHGSVNSVQ